MSNFAWFDQLFFLILIRQEYEICFAQVSLFWVTLLKFRGLT